MTPDEVLEMLLALGEMRTACDELTGYLNQGAEKVDAAEVARVIREFGIGVDMLSKVAGGRAAVAPTIPAPPFDDGVEPDPDRDASRIEAALGSMVAA